MKNKKDNFFTHLIFLNIIILFSSQSSFCQDNIVPEIFQPSPNVSELNKYIDYPVSTMTGVPSIQIPIYTIVSGDLQIPITLDYYAGGIKVDQEASNIGLGWSLNVGGNINRQERDFIDDFKIGDFGGFMHHKYGGILNALINYPVCDNNPEICTPQRLEINSQSQAGNIDNEADIFNINLPTINGEFLYNQQANKFELLEQKNIKINYAQTSNNGRIFSWQIIDPNGLIYNLGEISNPSDFHNLEYSENNFRNTVSSNSGNQEYKSNNNRLGINSWFLRNVKDTKGNQINFQYHQLPGVVYFQAGSSISLNNYLPFHMSYTATDMTQLFIKKIQFPNGEIEFELDSNYRQDLFNSKRLKSIKVYSVLNEVKTLLKKIVLNNNDYFNGKEVNGINVNNELFEPYLLKRLKLNSIEFHGSDSSVPPQVYSFEYDLTQLPQKLSYAKDYWGGYNGEDDNQYLTPELITVDEQGEYSTWQSGRAQRAVNKDYVQAGILKKITYPTKGYSVFEYEPNTVSEYLYLPDYNHNSHIVNYKNVKNPYKKTNYYFDTYHVDFNSELSCPIHNIENCSKCTRNIINENEAIYTFKFNVNYPLQSKIEVKNFNIECLNYSTPDDDDPVENPDGDGDNPPLEGQDGYSFDCHYNYSILDPNGVVVNGSNWMFAPIGEYTAKIRFTGDTDIIGHATQAPGSQLEINVFEDEYPDKRIVGGVRVKTISVYDSNDEIELSKDYIYEINDEFVSGITELPKFGYYGILTFKQSYGQGYSLGYILSDTNRNPSPLVGKTLYERVKIKTNNHEDLSKSYYKIEKYEPILNLATEVFSGDGGIPLSENLNLTILKMMETNWFPNYKKNVESYNNIDEIVAKESLNAVKSSIGYKFYTGFIRSKYTASIGNGSYTVSNSTHHFSYSSFPKILSSIIEEKLGNSWMVTSSNNLYNSNNSYLISETSSTNSLGEVIKKEFKYPQDLVNYPHTGDLILENRLEIPLQVKTSNNSRPISIQETIFEKDNTTKNKTLPKYQFFKNQATSLDNILPSEDLKITYNLYDEKGNLQQYTLENGIPVSIIWGYNGQYPIAKVEGKTYDQIQSWASTLINYSNNGTLAPSHFDSLRNLLDTMVTCYIYKPLVGVTTIIMPNGQKETYHYDAAGRLQYVKDNNGNILKQIDYHYKP